MYLLEEEHPCTGILVKRNSNMQVSLNEYVDYLWMLLEVEYSVYLLEKSIHVHRYALIKSKY